MFVKDETDSLVKEKLAVIERKGGMRMGERVKPRAQVIGHRLECRHFLCGNRKEGRTW